MAAASSLIGKQAEIAQASNKHLLGIKGKIINETKYTITILANNMEKTILKSQLTLKINNQQVIPKLTRPEEIK
ncbi:MAG TPA: ribonuclease P protein subunit [Candidatus Nanoarchaeia archaeon]|nr:ribonuclease P protein subunit [Candidatus Nanoarchaeia archaeon]